MGIISLSSNRVLHSLDRDPSPGTIEIDCSTGRIHAVHQVRLDDATYDYENLVIMPGLVDSHVHLNEPGRTEWEGFGTGTRAAISGGVTTVVDMPLNAIPPTTTTENLEIKLKAAQGHCHTDIALWGGLIPDNAPSLIPLVRAGVRGFKCFLIDSGVEEFPHVSAKQVELAMEALQDSGSILMFHAELDAQESHSLPPVAHDLKTNHSYQAFLDARPDSFEVDAISKVIEIARKYPALRLHIVHLASAKAVPMLREAQTSGLQISAETCFHYLTFQSDDIPANGTQYKCCPPIRSQSNREVLWDAIKDGIITTVVSDHSPCTPKLKDGDFLTAWGGVSALGLGLQILWTEASKRGFSIGDISRLTSENTAKQIRLHPRKGSLSIGSDADLVIWDPEALWTVRLDDLHYKNKISPYLGRELRGKVKETWLRGTPVWTADSGWTSPKGQPILDSAN